MATKPLTVIAKVKDAASAPLKKVQKGFKQTGKAVRKTGADFTQFNRVMFSATAFVGMFTRAFTGLTQVMQRGAEVDRVADQFERVLGPKGRFFQAISETTTNSIDRVEAMRSAIALGSLGIIRDSGKMAEFIAKAGTAAKMAGLDSSEGVKRFTQFMKTGSIANLEFLNLIAGTNKSLSIQMGILGKVGGPLGKVLKDTRKLAIGQALLDAATKGNLKGQRDLFDILQDSRQSFKLFGDEIGNFITAALGPLLDKISRFTFKLTDFAETIRKTDKHTVDFIKNLIIAGTTFATIGLSLGSFRLGLKALGALGLGGIPGLITLMAALAAGFMDTDSIIKTFAATMKKVGAVMMGAFQLTTSFLGDADKFKRGIGTMNNALVDFLAPGLRAEMKSTGKSLEELIQRPEYRLLRFTILLGKIGSVVGDFTRQVFSNFKIMGKFIVDTVSKVIDKLDNVLGMDIAGWARGWLASSGGIVGALAKITTGLLTLWGVMKLIRGVRGILGGIPIVGRFFKPGGGKGGSTKGKGDSPTNPLWVSDISNIGSALIRKGKPSGLAIGRLFKDPKGFIKGIGTAISVGVLGRRPDPRMIARHASLGGATSADIAKSSVRTGGIFGKGGTVSKIFAGIAGAGSKVWAALKAGGTAAWKFVASIKNIGTIIRTIWTGLKGLAVSTLILIPVFGLLEGIIVGVVENFTYFKNGILAVINNIRDIPFGEIVADLWNDSKEMFFDAIDFLGLQTAFTWLKTGFTLVAEWVGKFGDAIVIVWNKLRELPVIGVAIKAMEKAGAVVKDVGTDLVTGKSVTELIGFAGKKVELFSRDQTRKKALRDVTKFKETSRIPTTPYGQEQRMQHLMHSFNELEGQQQERFRSAMNAAMDDASRSGQTITAAEFEMIFRTVLDGSKLAWFLEKTSKNTEPQPAATAPQARKGTC